MTDKNKPTDKPTQPLTEDETSKVVGGMLPRGGGTGGVGGTSKESDSCKETTDTGMMGCPG